MTGVKILRTSLWFTLFLLSIILIFNTGCGRSGNFGWDVETDYLIDSLWADYPIIVSGGQTEIHALIIGANSRKPLKEVNVEFSTNIDTIENRSIITDENGIATTTFITFPDSTRRSATITAKVSAEQIRTKRMTIDILPINFIDPHYVFLNAIPDTVFADGVSRVNLEARVLGETYSPLAGHQVRFNFIEGNPGDLVMIVDSFALTNSNGIATAHFTVPSDSRRIIIDATVFGIGDTVSARDTVWVLDIPDVDFIDLHAEPSSIPADGISELILSAYVTVGATGTPAPNGTQITFSSEDGTLLPIADLKADNPKKANVAGLKNTKPMNLRGRPTSTRVAQTEGGYAYVKLRSSTTARRVLCTASASVGTGGTIEDSIEVRFTAGDPMSITVEAARSPILADGHDTTRITATVYDQYGNIASSGWSVTFETDKGTIFPPSANTDTTGSASSVLTSGVISGYARVIATCEGVSGFTEVLLSSSIPRYIQLNAQPNQLVADGTSSSTITAEVLDSLFNPVSDGVRINFSSSLGTLSGAKAMRGRGKFVFESMDLRQAVTSGGFASVTLTSGTLADTCIVAAWFAIYDTILGDTVITATDTLMLPFLPGDPSQVDSVTFSRDSILADGEDTCQVSAFVSDPYHNPVLAGHLITFDPDEGTVNPVSSNTDASGRAETKLTSSRSVGWHTVYATASGATPGSGDIYFYPILPDEIRLLMDVDSAVANGADSVLITAYVTDDEDRPCSDGTPVIFRTERGTFLPAASRAAALSSAKLDIQRKKEEIARTSAPRMRAERNDPIRESFEGISTFAPMADSFTVLTGGSFPAGIARINLISPTTIDSTFVYVSVATSDSTWAEDTMTVFFVPDAPSRIHLTAEPDTILADSSSTSAITASVFDAHGNRVGPGFLVEFEMAAGSEIFGAPVTLTDWTDDSDSSQAHTTFRSFYTAGEAVLNAKLSLFPSVSENVRIWLTGSSAGEVVLSTDSARIHIGSVMNVTANVYDSIGDPITDGTHVTFTVLPDTLATIVPSSPVTSGGIATAEFRPNTTADSCIVIATVGAIADTKTVQILPGEVTSIALTAFPPILSADGVSTSTVTATCTDVYGNPAEAGVSVSFTTDLGSIISPSVTDTNGIATTTFTAGVTIGTARIQANAGSAPTAMTNIELIGSEAHTLILTADSTHISIDGSGLGLTAYCVDGIGRPVSDGTRIDFSSVLGGFSSIYEFTVGGFVNTTLITGSDAGIDTVVASTITTTDTIADTLFIRYESGAANYISIEAADTILLADPRARTTITAICTDEYGNLLGAGQQVVFTSDQGSIISPVVTNASGIATTEYSASDFVGLVRIGASLDLANAWIYIEQIETTAAFISVTATPNRVTANGVDSAIVVARVLDASALPVSDGIVVDFSNNIFGGTAPVGTMPPFAATSGGDATISWRSPNYTAKAWVHGSVFGLEDSAIVDFISGAAAGITVWVDSSDTVVFADGESRGTIWAYVFDEYGNPIIGQLVIFSASPIGTYVFDRGYTDSTGTVSVQIFSNVSGNTTVMATAGGFTGYDELFFSPIVASEIFLSADDVRLVADGVSTTTIRAIVLDSMGVGVPDNTPVRFSTDSGFVFPGVAYTSSGEATTTLRASTTVGFATITGDAGDSVTGSTTVEFIPGPPAIIEFTPPPYDIPADGDTFTEVRVLVYDQYNNPVRAGVRVSFTTTLGTIDSMTFTDMTGAASVFLYAGTTPGTAVVWANSGDALSQVTVSFYSTFARNIVLYVDPRDVVADGRSTASVTGRVLDAVGMPVSDGSPVTFSVNPDSMGFITPNIATTDSGDFATVFNSRTIIGPAYIVARAGATVIDSVLIDLVPGSAASCSVWASPTSIPADSFSTSRCSVLVFDRFDHPVGAGYSVLFTATRGTIDPTSDITNPSGLVVADFTSGRTPGEARIRATSGTAWGETYITLTNAEVRFVNLTLDDPELVADGRSSTFARAMVTDSLGSPATDGTPVYFSIDTMPPGLPTDTTLASLSPTLAFTVAGEASVQVFSRDSAGRVWIKACCTVDTITSICDNAFLDLVPGDVDSIWVWAEDTLLPADGEAYTVVHAQFFDRYGNPLGSGITVQFVTSAGSIQPANTFTDGSGSAQAILTSGTVPSIARIDVTAGGRVGIGQVRFEAAPPEYLSLRADPRRIVADGESYSTITARIQNVLGQPVRDGTRIDFRSIDSAGDDFGSIEGVATTVGGEASVELFSETRTGTATVICSVSVDASTYLYDSVQVQFVPGDPFEVIVQSVVSETDTTPRDIIFADGRDSSTIRVFVYDRFGNPVESGNRIEMTISPVASLGSIVPSFGFTILDAPTTFRFLAGTSAGTAVITATTSAGPVGTKILRLVPLNVASIDLFADSMSLIANGVSSCGLRAIALDSMGMAVSDSTPIFFRTDVGFAYPGVAYTIAGVATSSLRSSTELDTATVIAYVGSAGDSGYIDDTVLVRFVSGPPQSIDIIPDPEAIAADGEQRSQIRTYVYDAVGNRVDGGYLVNYTTTLGTIDSLAVTGTVDDTNGIAITQLRSGITPGTALVMATSGSAVGIGRVDFLPDSLADASIVVAVDPNSLVADGLASATVSGMVRNSAGNPISDGTPVRLYTLPDSLGLLGFVSPTIVYTDSGKINATFTASTRAGSCNIVAYIGDTTASFISDTTRCDLVPGEPDSIAVWATPDTLPADSFSTAICSVAVFDRYRNPVRGGVTVDLSTSRGEIFPLSDETNSSGIVITTLRSDFTTGTARIVARAGTARGETDVHFVQTDIITISLTITDRIIPADGYTETECRATVLDTFGNPVSDGTPIFFATWPDTIGDTLLTSADTLGALIPQIAYTSTGIATTRFRVGTKRGRAWISASDGLGRGDQGFVEIIPGSCASIVLNPDSASIAANGRDETRVVATLLDDFGNRLLSGNSVQFGTDLGSIAPSNTFTNSAGDAYTILRAGTDPGIARVWAQSAGVFELTEVILRESMVGTLLLTANPVQLVADGMSQSIITCQVFDTDGSPVSDGTVVRFRVDPDTMGIVVSPKQTLGGSCVTTFTASTDVGTRSAWVIGSVTDTTVIPAVEISDSIRILLIPGPAATIEVWADTLDLDYPGRDTIWADGFDDITIYARVLDQYGNRMLAGKTVSFQTNRGTIVSSAITDTMGVARALLTADIQPGDAIIQARCDDAAGYHQVYMHPTDVDNIVLFADSTEMRANGTSRTKVYAHVYSDGGHLISNGTQVTFWVDSVGWAHPEPAIAFTDSGIATIYLRSDTLAGQIGVWATAESDTANMTLRLLPGPANRLDAYAELDSIFADGSSNVAVSCTVFDRYSNPVTPGTAVSFTTTLGSIGATAFTNTSGFATTRLTSGTVPGDALVTIRSGDAIDFVQVRFDSLLAAEIVLNIVPARLPGDGISTAEVTAYVFDSVGLPVSDGTRVSFQHINAAPNGIINPRIAFTSGGIATATLTAPLAVGTDSISATVGATVEDVVSVVYEPGDPAVIEFDPAFSDSLPADGSGMEQAVYVLDEFRNPVRIGTSVSFETTRGTVITPTVVEDATGRARTYISSTETGPALLTARSGSAVGSRVIQYLAIEANFVDLVANPVRIIANGTSTSNITVTVLDTSSIDGSRPVSDRTPVFLEVIGTGVVNPRTVYTSGGQATATLTSGVIVGDNQVVATVTETLKDTVAVEFVAGAPSILDFHQINPTMIADGADTQTVIVRVRDAFGNPVANGLAVNFSINKGYVTPISATGGVWPGDSVGYAQAVVVSGTDYGVASLSATCGSATNYATIQFIPLTADSLVLVVDPPLLISNGSSTASLTAVVFDSAGLPVSDGTIVRFSTTHGIINPAVAYTSGGIALSTLKAGTSPFDSVAVAASAGGAAVDTQFVQFIPGPPAVIEVTADREIIEANGVDSSMITVRVLDQYGNPVASGVAVNFSATLGTIIPTSYTDTAGYVTVRLIAGNTSGFSNVTITSGSATGNILIEFISTQVSDVTLTIIPPTLIANGSSTAEVSVVVLDSLGSPISDGTTVRFYGLNLGSITPIFATTTGGIARATISSYTSTGLDTLYARSGLIEVWDTISFISGPPDYILLSSADLILTANETDTTRIFGQVFDQASNPVGIGHVVNFSVEPAGYGTIWAADVTDEDGLVDVPFRAGRYAGVAIIRAECEGADGITQVELQPTNVNEIHVSVADRFMPADGVSSTQVSAFVTDSSGMEIADGTGVRFGQIVTPGSQPALLNPSFVTTSDGFARINLIAPTFVGSTSIYAYCILPDGLGGFDTIASVETLEVSFQPGNVSTIRFDTLGALDYEQINYVQLKADGEDTIKASISVEDAFGNGIPGATLNLTLATGTVVPPIGVTGSDGRLPFRITAPNRIGNTYLQASTGGVTGYLPVEFIPTKTANIALSVTPRGLPADGTSTANVRAIVTDSLGNPVSDGVIVRFTAKYGLIAPLDSLESGVATAILVSADRPSVDTVWASCQTETIAVEVIYDAGPADAITIFVTPDTATVGSSTLSAVTGMVTDAAGNPVARGTYVYISVDSTGMGSIADPVVATDDSGNYRTNYAPGLKAGLTGIVARVGSLTARKDFLLYAGPPHTTDIAVSRDFIYIRGVGEVDQSVISAVIYDQYDNPVRDSSIVVFRIVAYPTGGSLDPELIPGGTLISDTVYTINGRASATLRAGDRSGSIVVEATAYLPGGGTFVTRAPRITVGSGLPRNVSVSAYECNVRGWDVDGVPNQILAIITDEFLNPVAPGTAVWFTSDEGAITTSATTNDSGFAFATWFSSSPRTDGVVEVTAETRDTSGIRQGSVSFYASGRPNRIDISVLPGLTYADSTGFSDVRVDVWDVNENPVTDSTTVQLVTDWGSVISPIYTTNECYASYAIGRYTARNVYIDNYCASDTGGLARVTGTVGGISQSDTIFLKHDTPNSEESKITAPESVPYGYDFPVSVRIVDQWKNPICGELVELFGANATVLPPTSGVTGPTGEISFTVAAAPDTNYPSSGVIIARINSTGGTINVPVTYSSRRRPSPPSEFEIPAEVPPQTAIVPAEAYLGRRD